MPYTDKEKEQYLAYYESERNAGRTPRSLGVAENTAQGPAGL
jgi:hypothetical protein